MPRYLNKLFWFFLPFGQEIIVGQFSISIAQAIGALLVCFKLIGMKFSRIAFLAFLFIMLLHIVRLNSVEFPFYVLRNMLSIAFAYFAFGAVRTKGISMKYLVLGALLSATFFVLQYVGFDNFHALGKSPHGLMVNRNDYVFAQLIVVLLLMNSDLEEDI